MITTIEGAAQGSNGRAERQEFRKDAGDASGFLQHVHYQAADVAAPGGLSGVLEQISGSGRRKKGGRA